MKQTLLAHLSGKFSHQPELVATEALGHILSSSEPSREALRGILQAYGLDIGTIGSIQTEVIGDEGERPDLVCSDRAGEERLLIEAKFWAGLTVNQPVTYLKRLKDTHASALLVVGPAQRFEELWPELTRRVSETDDLELSDAGMDSEVRWAAVGDNRRLMMTSWRVLLDSLASRTDAAGDVHAVNDIRQLQGLADLQDSEAFLPLRPEQLGPEVPRLVGNLIRLFDDATSRIFETEWAAKNGMQRRWSGDSLFQYMNLGGFDVWFGLNFGYWFQHRETPLWFGFQSDTWKEHEEDILLKLEPLRLKDPPQYVDTKQIIPIILQTGAAYDTVLDDVVSQLKCIADLLQAP